MFSKPPFERSSERKSKHTISIGDVDVIFTNSALLLMFVFRLVHRPQFFTCSLPKESIPGQKNLCFTKDNDPCLGGLNHHGGPEIHHSVVSVVEQSCKTSSPFIIVLRRRMPSDRHNLSHSLRNLKSKVRSRLRLAGTLKPVSTRLMMKR